MFRDDSFFPGAGAGLPKTSRPGRYELKGLICLLVAMFAISLLGYILIVVLAIARM